MIEMFNNHLFIFIFFLFSSSMKKDINLVIFDNDLIFIIYVKIIQCFRFNILISIEKAMKFFDSLKILYNF